MAKHKNIKKIQELLEEMEEDFREKGEDLDKYEIGESKFNQKTEYYMSIIYTICYMYDYIEELKEVKLTDF